MNIESTPTSVTATFEYAYKVPDRSEVHITAGVGDRTGDGDQDGLSDRAEAKHGTNSSISDSDFDGITDGVEVQIGTDPLNRLGDADGDGVVDAVEIGQGMNPFDTDTDDDGLSDGAEYDRHGLLAIVPSPKSTDTDWDGDGISNDIEVMYGQNQSIPESQIPELKALTDLNYAVRSQLADDPVQQAILAADLQRELTPEQQDAFDDAVFDRGIASADVLTRYSFAAQLNAIDGTPIPAGLQASYEQAMRDLVQALTDRDLAAWTSYNAARGISLDAAAVDAFANPTTSDLLGDARFLTLNGVDVESLGGTKLGDAILADPVAAAATGLTSATAVDNTLDRMDVGSTPVAEAPPAGDGDDGTGDVGPAAAPEATPSAGAPVPAPSPSPTEIADAVGLIADDIAGQAGDGSSGLDTGTTEGDQLETRFSVDEDTLTGGEIEGFGTTSTGTTEDGRTYTETDLGEAGYKREYDDTGTVQFFNDDGTAKGGELDLHTEADPVDDEAGAEGEEEEPVDDGGSGEAIAYVNPDADVVGVPVTLSPVVAQIIGAGVDPTTTNPTGPDVDDSVAAVLVATGVATTRLDVPMQPGVVDGDPDSALALIDAGSPIGFDPTGPETIDPDDPLVGGGGEVIDAGDFTPRPSPGLTEGLGALGERGDGFSDLDL